MITTEQVSDIQGRNVVGTDGEKIGKIGQVYLDDETGNPEWVTVNTGMFGTNESFVPLREAELTSDSLQVPYGKDMVKDAPSVAADGHLEPHEEDDLYRYYSIDDTGTTVDTDRVDTDRVDTDRVDTGRTDTDVSDMAAPVATTDTDRVDTDRDRASVGRDTSGAETDEAMTRSEERVRVGTERREAGRARLRKYIVTENVTTTVPVSREEVRLEREPITDENRGDAMSGGDLTEEEHEVTLTEERPVVTTETVPVERVRLAKETVSDEQEVTSEVRKEQIDTDMGYGERVDTDRDDTLRDDRR